MSLRKKNFSLRAIGMLSGFAFLTTFSLAQSPGGVNTSLTFWLKANTVTPTNIVLVGSNVSQWKSEVGTHSVSQATASKRPVLVNASAGTVDFNFNPSIQFTNTSAQVLSNSATTPNLLGNTGTIFLLTNTRTGTSGGTQLTYYSSSLYRYQIKPDFRIQNGANSLGYKFELNTIPGVVKNYPRKAAIMLTSKGTGTTSAGRRNGTDAGAPTGASTTFNPAIQPGLYLGANGSSEYSNMAISEVIFFNTVLSAVDISRIESYLAMKFGITLNEVPGNNTDYIASNGTIVWNRAANAPYNADITFISRDDASGLLQKQSRSVDSTSIVTLYNGASSGVFPDMNSDNTSTISSDLSFFGIGDNKQTTNLTQCVLQSRHGAMARVWKVQKTGTGTSSITVAVSSADVSPLITNLLVSTDPTFATATIYPLAAASGKLYTDVNFTGNEYFTFATDSVIKPLSANVQVCSGSTASVQVSNVQSGVTYNWYSSATGGTSLASGNTYSIPGISANTTVWLEAVGPTNCIYPGRTQVDLNVDPSPLAPTVNDMSICSNATATLQVTSPQTGLTYNWYDQATGGTLLGTGTNLTTTSLIADTIFYVEAVSSGGCPGPRTVVTVSVIETPSDPVVNPVNICAGNTATLQVQSPVSGVEYTWYATSTGGTALATASSYTTAVLNAGTTFYVKASSTTGGCSSAIIAVPVVVEPLPASPIVVVAPVCLGATATLQVQNPPGGISYSWYDVSIGGIPLGTGNSYSAVNITGPATFYVEATGNGNCTSSRVPVTVNIVTQLATPVVTVTATTLNSITFSWNAIPGAQGYEVSVDGGTYIVPTSGPTGLTHVVTGLAQAQTVNLSVRAIGALSCQLSSAGTASGTTQVGTKEIFIPNVFTPNGDGKNDQLKVYGNSIASLNMCIFNQFGQLIFETKDMNQGWNGTHKGKPQPSGVYTYVVKVVQLNGETIIRNGAVNIVR
jgi:gliding motility-associated-like protein